MYKFFAPLIKKSISPIFLFVIMFSSIHCCYAVPVNCNGGFRYVDKDYNETGWTGTYSLGLVRFAHVSVFAQVGGFNVPIGSGSTDGAGNFSFTCDINPTWIGTPIFSFAVAETAAPSQSELNAISPFTSVILPNFIVKVAGTVVGPTQSSQLSTFGISSNTILTTAGQTMNFGVATSGVIFLDGILECNPFNIYDSVVSGLRFAQTLPGVASGLLGKQIEYTWPLSPGGFVQGNSAKIAPDDCYDDSVLLAHLGSILEYYLSDSDSLGGVVSFNESNADPRTAYSYGWAMGFSGMVLNWLGRPGLYADYIPALGVVPGDNGNRVELEDGAPWNDGIIEISSGGGDQIAIAGALYDIVDDALSKDKTPNVDDDPIGLPLLTAIDDNPPANAIWKVVKGPIKTANKASINDFWNGWFELFDKSGQDNSHFIEMREIFEKWGMHFYPDPSEPDNKISKATPLDLGAPALAIHSLYKKNNSSFAPGTGDADNYTISLSSGQNIVIETFDPLIEFSQFLNPITGQVIVVQDTETCHTQADTLMKIYKPNGKEYSSDNDSGECRNSRIEIADVPTDGLWRIEVRAKTKLRKYGSYRISVSEETTP